MADKTIVDYEQLREFAKKFANEGEVLAQLTSQIRQSVNDLKGEWIGAGSDAFFDEMETELLPALKRLHEAMTFSGATVNNISKIYRSAEEEGSNFIKNYDGSARGLGSFDFGASDFGNLGGMGGIAGGVGLADADFGSSDFDNLSGGGPSGGTEPGIGEADYGASDFDNLSGGSSAGGPGGLDDADYGASDFENLSETQGESGGQQSSPQENQEPQEVKMDASESSAGGAGGGGTGGGGSSGLQGDLNDMGTGLTGEDSGGSTGGGGGSSAAVGGGTPMADHVYQSGGSAGGGGGTQGPSGAPPPSSSPPETPQEGDGINAARTAGVVGGVGAVAGAAKKVVKDKDQK